MVDVAVVGYGQMPSVRSTEITETQMLFPVIEQAIKDSGVNRKEIGFTCSGSCDYLAGAPFAFVSNLEATGAWPPISESHVEMDGAWALYEAWVRLQEGDVDTALVFSSGTRRRADPRGPVHAARPVLPGAAVARPRVAGRPAGPGPARLRTATRRRTSPRSSPARANVVGNPNAQLTGKFDVDELLAEPYVASAAPPRLPAGLRRRGRGRARRRRHGGIAVRAAGVDPRHRPPHRPPLARRPRSHRLAVDGAGGGRGGSGIGSGAGGRDRHRTSAGGHPARCVGSRRLRRGQPVGWRPRRQPGDGHRSRAHHRGCPSGHRAGP